MIKELLHEEVIGLDTESIVGQTKFDKGKVESAIIIQIATKNRVFIIDALGINNIQLFSELRNTIFQLIEG